MTEGLERMGVTVDCKHGGPPKVGDKSPKVGGPFQIDHIDFDSSFEKGHTRFEIGHYRL